MFLTSRRRFSLLATCCVAALHGPVLAQTPAAAAPTQRLRATIEKIDATTLTVKDRGGEVVTLALPEGVPVTEVLPIAIDAIQPGAFIGTASLPNASGKQVALEVLVFPEAARGTGEGHYPWDLQPQSMMTNATVADLAQSAQGRTLTLKYKGGEQTVLVPDTVPIVTFKPADRSLLVVGARVLVTATVRDGTPTAIRVLAGRNGFAPPM
jgi:hypothetical protein